MTTQVSQTTPGPWIWRGKSGSLHQAGKAPYTYGKTVLSPTYEYESGVDTEVSDADALLIAAAPDLLDACKQAVELFEDDEGIAQVLFSAIAKAEGRSDDVPPSEQP